MVKIAWRPRYCDAVFRDIIDNVGIDFKTNVLEIGPGTGQATEPILKNGCNYKGIELVSFYLRENSQSVFLFV